MSLLVRMQKMPSPHRALGHWDDTIRQQSRKGASSSSPVSSSVCSGAAASRANARTMRANTSGPSKQPCRRNASRAVASGLAGRAQAFSTTLRRRACHTTSSLPAGSSCSSSMACASRESGMRRIRRTISRRVMELPSTKELLLATGSATTSAPLEQLCPFSASVPPGKARCLLAAGLNSTFGSGSGNAAKVWASMTEVRPRNKFWPP
mmetsp:Transcript_67621/g.210016  ORF Transcript_67621/g.210016 Transcript_67621/m.210016 type:complete len:208 (+) Transcript_67621:18-641(+)